jgi:two-component system sensor histidine kinase KdpD
LINLLDNAAKFSPPGSEIEVGVEPDSRFLQVWVADHGSGIPTADLERIFEKFYRIERPDAVHGTGLGLSICKGIVEAHGGQIWAENRPEGGARITFRLPAVQETLILEETALHGK